MSTTTLQENATRKIQGSWRKYRESHSCPICLKIIGIDSCTTKCGHKFCTGCLLKAVSINSSCPLCRGQLIENQEVENQEVVVEDNELGISLSYYDQGYEDGFRNAAEELRVRMQEEIDIATQKAYDDGFVKGKTLANEDMRLLREEIKRLKQRNSRMREDIQFMTQPTSIY